MDFEDVLRALVVFLLTIIVICLAAILVAFPTMWLWNWLMPVLFKLPEVTVWQALGLNLLSGLLLKSAADFNLKSAIKVDKK